jgi:hypothetical protein
MFYFENTRGSHRNDFEFYYEQGRDLGIFVTQTNNSIGEKQTLVSRNPNITGSCVRKAADDEKNTFLIPF